MIESITIKNFQAHANLHIDFSDVSSIIGASDTGKSTILRALRWVLLNESSGTIERWESKETTVAVVIDGVELERSRKGSKNTYRLGNEEYTAFGRDVPEPIADFLRVVDINFQWQHDAVFWFSQSAGEVSRRLNKIVDLELVDSTMKNIASQLRQSTAALNNRKEELKQHRKERKQWAWTVGARKALDETRQLSAILSRTAENTRRIDELVKAVVDTTEYRENALQTILAGKITLKIGRNAVSLREQGKQLAKTVDAYQQVSTTAHCVVPDIENLAELQANTQTLRNNIQRITDLLKQIDEYHEQITSLEKTETKTTDKLNTEFEGICPLCGNALQ